MTINININDTVTIDESGGLQNAIDTPAPPSDADDNDVDLSVLQAGVPDFYNRLFDALELNLDDTFAIDNGVAESPTDFIDITADGMITDVSFGINGGDGTASGLFTLDGTQIYLSPEDITNQKRQNTVQTLLSSIALLFSSDNSPEEQNNE